MHKKAFFHTKNPRKNLHSEISPGLSQTAGEGTRTLTPSQKTDFESVASTIPPLRHTQSAEVLMRTQRTAKVYHLQSFGANSV